MVDQGKDNEVKKLWGKDRGKKIERKDKEGVFKKSKGDSQQQN